MNRLRHSFFDPILGALCSVLIATTAVAETRENAEDEPTSVTPAGHPTEVATAAYLISLSRVSASSEAFPTWDVDMLLDLSWRDPRLAFSGTEPRIYQGEEAEEWLSEVWSPYPEIQNEVEQRQTESIAIVLLPDGTVQYEERFGATLQAELDLARFPFDTQTFEVNLQSFLWVEQDFVFVINDEQTGFEDGLKTPEWTVTGVEATVGTQSEVRDERNFHTFTFRIHAKRNAGHYLLRFVIPLVAVMGLTFAAFFLAAGDRIRLGFIALLTVVAWHSGISQQLPRIHYPTFADMLLYICYVFVAALIIVSIRVVHLEKRNAEVQALVLERRTRWILPTIAVITLLGSTLLLLF